MMTIEVVLMKDRFENLLKFYDERKIKVISKDQDEIKGKLDMLKGEFVLFEITIDSAYDVLDIFSAGARYGIHMDVKIPV